MSPFRSAIYTRWASSHSGTIVAALALTFCLVAMRWRSRAFRAMTGRAAMFTGAMLIAMFADVFVEHTIGYIVIAAALVVFYGVVRGVERLAVGQPEPMSLLSFGDQLTTAAVQDPAASRP